MDRRIPDGWRGQPPERLVLVAGILSGLVGLTGILAGLPGVVLGQTAVPELDFHAYYFAGEAILEGRSFVGWGITEQTFLESKAYVYPPITGLLFVPYALLTEWYYAFVIHVIILLGTFGLLARSTIRYIEQHGRELAAVDRWLITGFVVFSFPSVLGLVRGNVDPIILLLILGGFFAVEAGRQSRAGTLWAIAAVFKLFPAMLGVWFLYRRAYRAVAVAVAVGVGVLGASVLVFGLQANLDFVQFVLNERSRSGAFVGGLEPGNRWITLRRPLSHLVPIAGHQLTLVSVVVLAAPLAVMYARIDSDFDAYAVFVGTLVAALITIVPATLGYLVYLVAPLVPLVYLVEDRSATWCFLGAIFLLSVPLFAQDLSSLASLAPGGLPVFDRVVDILYSLLRFGSLGLWAFILTFVGCYRVVGSTEVSRP